MLRLCPLPLLLAGTLFLGCPGNVYSAESKTEVLFRQGQQAFNAGNYTRALALFNEAKALGPGTPALYFNLGTTYYRLKNYPQANDAFLVAAESPRFQAMCYLNLGLVAIKGGDEAEARVWLEKAQSAGSDNVAALARTLIDRLAPVPAGQHKQESLVFFSIGVGAEDKTVGVDDNNTVFNTPSRYLEVSGFAQRGLPGNLLAGTSITANGFALVNEEQPEYNLSIFGVGLDHEMNIGRWNASLGGNAGQTRLGGSPYQGETSLQIIMKRNLEEGRVALRYKAAYFVSLDDAFDYLEGMQHKVRMAISKPWASLRLKAQYEFEYNDRADSYGESSFASYSPIRHIVRLNSERAFGLWWRLKLVADYRASRYRKANYDANLRFFRIEDRVHGEVSLNRKLSDNWAVVLGYDYTRNYSTIGSYNYTRNQIALRTEFVY